MMRRSVWVARQRATMTVVLALGGALLASAAKSPQRADLNALASAGELEGEFSGTLEVLPLDAEVQGACLPPLIDDLSPGARLVTVRIESTENGTVVRVARALVEGGSSEAVEFRGFGLEDLRSSGGYEAPFPMQLRLQETQRFSLNDSEGLSAAFGAAGTSVSTTIEAARRQIEDMVDSTGERETSGESLFVDFAIPGVPRSVTLAVDGQDFEASEIVAAPLRGGPSFDLIAPRLECPSGGADCVPRSVIVGSLHILPRVSVEETAELEDVNAVFERRSVQATLEGEYEVRASIADLQVEGCHHPFVLQANPGTYDVEARLIQLDDQITLEVVSSRKSVRPLILTSDVSDSPRAIPWGDTQFPVDAVVHQESYSRRDRELERKYPVEYEAAEAELQAIQAGRVQPTATGFGARRHEQYFDVDAPALKRDVRLTFDPGQPDVYTVTIGSLRNERTYDVFTYDYDEDASEERGEAVRWPLRKVRVGTLRLLQVVSFSEFD